MIHERDGRTHRQTDRHSRRTPHDDIGRAYASHRAAKIYNSFRMAQFSMTVNDPNSHFNFTPIIDAEYVSNGTR